MATMPDRNKAKAAQRVIEVLEFFDEKHREATVMDIVRRYKRPQSSTSELLASLVDLGLLYKDAQSRSYTLSPRAAILGSLAQPSLVRDGRLNNMIDGLVAHTGLGVALFGMVGMNAQIFRWTEGATHRPTPSGDLWGGAQERLSETTAGWLLLSTMPPDRRHGTIRRLNAEADEERKFNVAEMSRYVQDCALQGHAAGAAGFGGDALLAAVLLPHESGERPMALGFIYERDETIDASGLVSLLQRFARRCAAEIAADEPLGMPVAA